jgi:hypothetical protein
MKLVSRYTFGFTMESYLRQTAKRKWNAWW